MWASGPLPVRRRAVALTVQHSGPATITPSGATAGRWGLLGRCNGVLLRVLLLLHGQICGHGHGGDSGPRYPTIIRAPGGRRWLCQPRSRNHLTCLGALGRFRGRRASPSLALRGGILSREEPSQGKQYQEEDYQGNEDQAHSYPGQVQSISQLLWHTLPPGVRGQHGLCLFP